jgi:iron(III) transport system substrate-binding protein
MSNIMRILTLAAGVAVLWVNAAVAQTGDAVWDKVVAAAEKEGTIIINSQPNLAWREFIQREFSKAYPKITVNLSVIPTEEFMVRVRTERSAGKYLWDVAASGAIGGFSFYKDNIIDPIQPELVRSDVNDPALWGGWDEALVDLPHKYVFSMSAYLVGVFYNAKMVPPETIERLGLDAMMQPQYVGKAAWHDPTVAGGGQIYVPLFRQKGDDWLKRFVVDQKVVFYPQQQGVVEAMARGTAAFGIGPPVRSLIAPYLQAGAASQVDIRGFGNKPESNLISIGGNCLYVFNNRPHPNATRVFVNWMLQKDVQYALAKALDMTSRRQDVPPTAPPDEIPIKGAKYLAPQAEENFSALTQGSKFIEDLRKSMR